MSANGKDESKAKGGIARAKSLTPEKRKDIAKRGALARWGAKAAQSTHKGNFKDEFGIDVDCYVLNDDQKTAVISQRGMGLAIGLKGGSGVAFPNFINGKVITNAMGADLLEKVNNPLIFNGSQSGAPSLVNGYDVTILIDVCKAIIKAENDRTLLTSQSHIAKQAHIILNASAKAGIQGLVYALSGYDRTKDEVIAAYKLYVIEEAREYEREFSPELYAEWYRLYKLPKYVKGRPWEFRYLTIDHIYHPLAKSNGKVFNLAKSSKAENGKQNDKIHQFLSEIGVKALRTQVGKILGIAMVSETREEYERHIKEKIFGQKSLDFSND